MLTMIIYSFIIGYIFSMALLAYRLEDITINLNKIYMACLMALLMGIYETFMHQQIIFFLISVTFSIMLVIMIRNQYGINEDHFLLSMIEHHSAALTMADKIKSKTSDVRIIKLADNILESQSREIEEMNYLLKSYK